MKKKEKRNKPKTQTRKAPSPPRKKGPVALPFKFDPDDEGCLKRMYEALDDAFGSIMGMCETLKFPRLILYRRFDSDPEFRKRFYAMRGEVLDKVEDLLIERATKGEMQWVHYGGRRVDVKMVPDNHLLLQLVKSRKPEYRDGSLVSVTLPGSEVNPINPNVREFIMSETGNKLAHEMLMKYMEWGEKKGINVGVGEDWTPIEPEPTPERPLPQDGDAEKLEHRKGLKLVEGGKDEEDKNED